MRTVGAAESLQLLSDIVPEQMRAHMEQECLLELAAELCARPAPPPDGVPAEIHELLLANRAEIERLSLEALQHLPCLEL